MTSLVISAGSEHGISCARKKILRRPYMIDETLRQILCTGAHPRAVAYLTENFRWGWTHVINITATKN
jgi:hypothetical protein